MNKRLAKTACFTGHRQVYASHRNKLTKRLNKILEHLIKTQKIDSFLCGGAIGFDILAGFAVLNLKEKWPHIKLIMVLPCPEQDSVWSEKYKIAYRKLLASADEIIYVSEHFYNGCMEARNIRLVEEGELCIAYLINTRRSGTSQTVRFAKEKGIPVINLADDLLTMP